MTKNLKKIPEREMHYEDEWRLFPDELMIALNHLEQIMLIDQMPL